MSALGERLYRQAPEDNPLQKAMDDYLLMERELAQTKEHARDLTANNQALVVEVNMLREELQRTDEDRLRLQAVSSTLLGRLLAINDCIAGAVRASIKEGIEATAEKPAATEEPEEDLEQAAAEVQGILQRVTPQPPPEPPAVRIVAPAPPQVAGAGLPAVDWTRLPRG